MIYSRVNVLVLDEPTNHLDIPSREALEEALSAYEGTIVTISHDRYFLDRVATQILALDGEGSSEHYDGDYTEYHDWKAAGGNVGNRITTPTTGNRMVELSPLHNDQREIQNESSVTETEPKKGAKAKQALSRKQQSPAVKVIKKKREARSPEGIEAEIASAESRLNEISEQMSQPEVARDMDRFTRLSDDFRQAEVRLRALYEEWERVAAAQ